MRIAILGSIALPVPPPFAGGTEWIAYHQAIGLSKKGHEVLLFGAHGTRRHFEGTSVQVVEVGQGDLVTGSTRESVLDKATTEGSRKLRIETSLLSQVSYELVKRQEDFDLILNNMRGEAVFFPVAKLLQKPFVTILHLNLFPELAEACRLFAAPLITISNAQQKSFPDLSYLGTVYNAVDTEHYTFNSKSKDYLLMVGSIGRHKNQKAAIEVAKRTGRTLVIAGKIRDRDYFEELEPLMKEAGVMYKSELDFAEKVKLYQEAYAFIFPINWEEPFGLVMIEAMSCGTPVIALNRGAVPEVVVDGKTGFVVEDVEGMADAVSRIQTIRRQACRGHVLAHFTPDRMVSSLEKALLSLP